MPRNITDYIRRPDVLDDDAIQWLKALSAEYPYFHACRILLLEALYKKHDPAYDETLRRTAILVPSREAIFRLTEEPHYTEAEEHKRYENAPDGDRTVSLIDNFLGEQNVASPASRPVDAAQDYIGYLLWQESLKGGGTSEALPMNGGGVVEDFLQNESGRIILSDHIDDDADESPENETSEIESEEENDDNTFATQNDEKGEILTEIMAGIYIKQGKYENAVKIIRQLSLKYPKKNRYFADQIRFLEKLITNNKHK